MIDRPRLFVPTVLHYEAKLYVSVEELCVEFTLTSETSRNDSFTDTSQACNGHEKFSSSGPQRKILTTSALPWGRGVDESGHGESSLS